MKDLSEFLEFTLFKVGQYKLNVGMLFAIAFVIVFNYILLFVVKYIIHKQESKNHYTQNRMLSIFLLIKYISWIFVFLYHT
jgi:heme/copper-type cytochrome/quinol oxidase subunit 2